MIRKHSFRSVGRSLFAAAAAILMLVGLSACDGANDPVGDLPNNRTIWQTVQQETNLSILEQAVEAAGLSDQLAGDGPVTLFAVRNSSFAALEQDSILDNEELLGELVQYHIVEGEVRAEDLTEGQTLETMQGETLTVQRRNDQIYINGALITSSNIPATNGVIHAVGRLLFVDLVDQVRFTNEFSSLFDALEATDLTGELGGDQPVTVFAPTNAAFDRILGQGVDSLMNNPDLLGRVLSAHVVEGKVSLDELQDGAELETLEGTTLNVGVDADGNVTIEGIPVATERIETADGIFYRITDVLLNASTIAERVAYLDETTLPASDEEYSFLEVVSRVGLTDLLNREGPYTVFVPTNDAFGAIDADTLVANEDLLDETLRYHIIEGQRLLATDFQDGESVMTIGGDPLAVNTAADGSLVINGVRVTTTDIETRNGVIHLIDQVLLEQATTQERLEITPETNTYSSLLERAGLEDLGGSEPYTVFVPSNAAFEAINGDTLREDADLLDEVLRYHVVQGQELTEAELPGQTLTTWEGGELTISEDAEGNLVVNGENGAAFTTTDIQTEDGVVHIIDSVLLETTSVAERAALMPRTSTFSDLTVEAGLNDELNSAGPYTAFVPANAAFEAINADTLEEDSNLLRRVLNYHLVEGTEYTSEELSDGQTLTTRGGAKITVNVDADGNIRLNGEDGAAVTTTDIQTENGVIHIIGDVLLQNTNVVQRLNLMPRFSTFARAVAEANLESTLSDGSATFTVFAPTDAEADTLATLVDSAATYPDELAAVVKYHIVQGQEIAAEEINNGQTVETMEGSELTFRFTDDMEIQINRNAIITDEDIQVRNGILHAIDAVLLPPEDSSGGGS